MRKSIISILFTLLLGMTASARSFTVNITPDSASTLSVFLPDGQPTASRMVIILPGGGYAHLAMQHEGTDWAPYFNSRGIAVGVLSLPLRYMHTPQEVIDGRDAEYMVRLVTEFVRRIEEVRAW